MKDDSAKDMFSRRQFLGTGSAALAAAGIVTGAAAMAQDQGAIREQKAGEEITAILKTRVPAFEL